jgi:hypothetical protein
MTGLPYLYFLKTLIVLKENVFEPDLHFPGLRTTF